MARIIINGKTFEAAPGQTIIELADQHDIYIPRFCYHHRLSVAANCRMCLVEVENARKPLPACATPIADGMKIFTQSKATLHSQRAVMEFLLINHPLDCPICDQGGQCELQDLAMGFGQSASHYNHSKTAVVDEDIGPLIATEMTRCIKCSRCIRFGEEIAGVRELGMIYRGERATVATCVKQVLQSELSGNIIELCPVGALLSKPFLYQARAWEMTEHAAIAGHDCLGSHIFIHVRRGQIMRVTSRECEAINDSWLSDCDRFSYLGIKSQKRLTAPLMKINGQWQITTWKQALQQVALGLKRLVEQHGAKQLGALLSPSSTLEEAYLLQRLCRSLGCHNIDYRLRQTDFSDQDHLPLYLGLDCALTDIAKQQAILLIGADTRHEQPLANWRVRQASLNGSKIMAINAIAYDVNFNVAHQIVVRPSQWLSVLLQIIAALPLTQKLDDDIASLMTTLTITPEARAIAEILRQTPQSLILLGATANHHHSACAIRRLVAIISQLTGTKLGFLTQGANSAGISIAGGVPHRGVGGKPLSDQGLPVDKMLKQPLKAYITMGIEPELDCANGAAALRACRQAQFVVALSAYDNDYMRDYADIMLPIVPFAETSGTFVNVEGRWQSFNASVLPLAKARPAWKVLRLLSNLLEIPRSDYNSSEEIRDELKKLADSKRPKMIIKPNNIAITQTLSKGLERLNEVPMYAIDSVVRHAIPLQATLGEAISQASMHSATAKQYGIGHHDTITLAQDGNAVTLVVAIDDRLAKNSVLIRSGIPTTLKLGAPFGPITIVGK